MAYGALIECTCANCGKKWQTTKSKIRMCCGKECSETYRIAKMTATRNPESNIVSRACEICGCEFTVNIGNARGRNKRTCGRVCRGKTERPRISGDDHHMKKPEQREKVKQTTIAKYGAIGMAVPEISAKVRGKMMGLYGVEHALQNPVFLAAARANTDDDAHAGRVADGVMAKHGVRNIMQLPAISEKASTTRWNQDKNQIYKDICTPEWWQENYTDTGTTIRGLMYKFGIGETILSARASELGVKIINRSRSHVETELCTRISGFAAVVENSRKIIPPQEIDIWLPDHGIAVEVNGLYWHTSDRLGNTYHRDKMRAVQSAGGRLMQFWDYEVEKKGDLVIGMIRNACGLCDNRIGARKLSFIDVERATGAAFMDENHLQGSGGNTAKYVGLIDDGGVLLACMSHGPSRFRKGATEILRFAIKQGYSIPGAFTRLIKRSGITGTIVSYSDNRYTTGRVYDAAGFKLASEGPPTMWGTKNYDVLIPRQKFMSIKTWEGADPDATQVKNMGAMGYGVIHDAGQKTWILEI